MKIKDIFEIEVIDGKQFMVCLDSTVLAGMIELNETAAFIVNCLFEETTVDQIADKLVSEYDVEKEAAIEGAEQIINQLRQLGVIEE